MRSINLLAHTFTWSNINLEEMEIYSKHEMLYKKSNLRENEENDLKEFVKKLHTSFRSADIDIFNGFFYNFTIPQISKEFDLLRINEDSVINIELKNYSTQDKILKQLSRSRYFLSFLNRKCFLYCYIVNNDTLYELNENDELKVVEMDKLVQRLQNQKNVLLDHIETFFDVSNYLISPFNKTSDFIKNNYFLNGQQELFKDKILEKIDGSSSYELLSLSGSAGSGKSLLIYDIAKDLIERERKVNIIHCGILNDGHKKLIREYGWQITIAKDYKKIDFMDSDIIIIDEGQRIYCEQLKYIINKIIGLNKVCIFCHDPVQILSNAERNSGSLDLVEKYKTDTYKLSGKIRSNMEIVYFIDSLFKTRNKHNEEYNNIIFQYCKNYKQAKFVIKGLVANDWKFINFTPCTYRYEDFECLNEFNEGVAHTVIGQEYDNVVCIIDKKFYYEDNMLKSKGWLSDKNGEKMLYQGLTRARKKLYLIIIDNKEIFNRCLNIVNNVDFA